ncbi:MAG: hypothetical protein GY778_28840 [bacterium]|nr:hypothetical protein [bacterium]
MAFTPEDGTGLPDANAYITVEQADDYHDDRRNTEWDDIATKDKEAFIIRATDLIEQRYRFRGSLVNETQALQIPRANLFTTQGILLADDEVPAQVQKATAELALSASRGDLDPDGTDVQTSFSEKAGGVTISGTRAATRNAYHKTQSWLYDILAPRSLLRS